MKRKNAQESSLELLLDTICNTFGGVIFLAILVVILVQMSSRTEAVNQQVPSASKLKELEQQRTAKEAKLKVLRLAASQRSEIVKQLAKPENRELLEKLRQLQSQVADLTAKRSSKWGEASQKQIDVNKVAEELQKLDKELSAAREALAAAEAAMQRETAVRARTGRYSMLRETKKSEMAVFMRRGRFYQMAKRTGSGQFVFNDTDCEERTVGALKEIVPKPGAGQPMDGAFAQTVDQAIANYDKDTHYLAVFVWPDSFPNFQVLKDAMVRGGVEYRLEPLPATGQVFISQAAPGPTQVQ